MLAETFPSGQTRGHTPGGGTFALTMNNRPDGRYTYELTGCYFEPIPNISEVYEVCELVGASLPVTVNGPDPDSVGTQLGYTFQARVNSTNPDTATAIFIDRTSSATGAGVFQDIVLRKNGSAFELVAPDSVTGTPPSGWSATTAVALVLSDINLDGFVDILVRGLGGATGPIAGALDQIVYAPGRTSNTLGTLKAVDSSLTNFLSEVSAWTRNPAYFDNAMGPVTVVRHRFVRVCWEDEFVGENLERYCGWVRRPISTTVTRPTNSSPEARAFAEQFPVVNGRIDPIITPGSSQAINISQILLSVLGVEVFEGELERSCAPTESCQSRSNYYTDAVVVANENFWKMIDNTSEDEDGDGTIEPGEYRTLTGPEKESIRQFGYHTEIDLDGTKIYHQPKYHTRLGRPGSASPDDWFTIGSNVIGVSECDEVTGNFSGCFMEEFTMTKELASLMHELTHVWQRSNFLRILTYPAHDVSKYGENEYTYRLGDGTIEDKDFLCFTREQQAEIIADLYRLKNDENTLRERNRHGTSEEMQSDLEMAIGDPPLVAEKPSC